LQVAAVTSVHQQQLQQLHASHAIEQSTSKVVQLQSMVSTQEVMAGIIRYHYCINAWHIVLATIAVCISTVPNHFGVDTVLAAM